MEINEMVVQEYEAVRDYSGRKVVGFCVNCNELFDFTKWTLYFFQQLNCPAVAIKQIKTFVWLTHIVHTPYM